MHDGDGTASSVFLQLNSSKQGRSVRERDCLREKMADLDFRVEARLEAAKELADVAWSDKDRRIGLLGIHGTHVFDRDRNVFRKARCRCELDSALAVFGGSRGAQVFEEKSDKARIGRGVEQSAFARPPAHGCERTWI